MKIKFQGTVREFLNLAEECFNLDGTMSAKIDSPPPGPPPPPPEALYIVGLTDAGRSMKINCIKEIRELTGMMLKEAKDLMEDFDRSQFHGLHKEPHLIGKFSGIMPKVQFLELKAI